MINCECPFFVTETSRYLTCEIGKIKFPDLKARNNIVLRYCAGNYKECMFYKNLQEYYERKYET